MSKQLTRRKFIKSAAITGAASTLGMPAIVRAQNQNSKLQVGFVATGGRASAHVGFTHGARNKYGLQCLNNLDLLPPVGAVVIATPLKIKNGTGSPLRVLALVPRSHTV